MSSRAPSNSPQIDDPDNSDIIKVIQPYMRKDVYDVLEDGTVDNSTMLGNKTLAIIEAERDSAILLANTPNQTHIANTSNPHGITPTQLNLGNVDNTADTDKPISDATTIALANKLSTEAFNTEIVDHIRVISTAEGTAGTGWTTVAKIDNNRGAGVVYVSNGDTGNHAFIKIDWLRSYTDTVFNVINVGGFTRKYTGVRVLRDATNATNGIKFLQVYNSSTSPVNHSISITNTASSIFVEPVDAVIPIVENTKSGFVLQGNSFTELNTVSFVAAEGIKTGGSIQALDFIESKGLVSTDGGVTRIANPGGGSANIGTATGAIKVTLPVSWSSNMLTVELSIYDYASGESFKVFVAGYNYANGSWVNTAAWIECMPTVYRVFTARYGYSNGKCCFYIGEFDSSWTNLQVSVVQVTSGFTDATAEDWATGWAVSIESSAFDAVTSQINADQVGRTIGRKLILHEGMDSGWLVPTLVNGWVPYGGVYGNEGVRYKKYPSGLVEVQLGVKIGLYGLPIATLPIGYRPDRDIILSVMVEGVISRVDIRSDGSIFPYDNPIGNGWLAGTLLYYGDM